MSDTPRTDAAECEAITGLGRCVGVNVARELERENMRLREALSLIKPSDPDLLDQVLLSWDTLSHDYQGEYLCRCSDHRHGEMADAEGLVERLREVLNANG